MVENSHYGPKRGYSEVSTDLKETTFSCQTSKIGQILPKTILNLKMSHIQLIQVFQIFEPIFPKLKKNSHFGKKRTILEKLGITRKKTFFSKEFEMCQIQSKTDSDFKMSLNGHFVAILEFSIFVGNGRKQPLWGKKRLSVK